MEQEEGEVYIGQEDSAEGAVEDESSSLRSLRKALVQERNQLGLRSMKRRFGGDSGCEEILGTNHVEEGMAFKEQQVVKISSELKKKIEKIEPSKGEKKVTHGAQGLIYLKQQYVAKVSYVKNPFGRRTAEDVCRERRILAGLPCHPNIVNLIDFCRSSDGVEEILIYERCNLDLYDYLGDLGFSNSNWGQRAVVSDDNLKRLFFDLLEALAFCEKKGTYHIDLKDENVLLVLDDYGNIKEAKLGDFGRAVQSAGDIEEILNGDGWGPSEYQIDSRFRYLLLKGSNVGQIWQFITKRNPAIYSLGLLMIICSTWPPQFYEMLEDELAVLRRRDYEMYKSVKEYHEIEILAATECRYLGAVRNFLRKVKERGIQPYNGFISENMPLLDRMLGQDSEILAQAILNELKGPKPIPIYH